MNSTPHTDDIALTDLRQWAMEQLSAAGILEADVDAELLIGHIQCWSRGELASKLVTGSQFQVSLHSPSASLLSVGWP
jgi:release factor glutamine methyltransferase